MRLSVIFRRSQNDYIFHAPNVVMPNIIDFLFLVFVLYIILKCLVLVDHFIWYYFIFLNK